MSCAKLIQARMTKYEFIGAINNIIWNVSVIYELYCLLILSKQANKIPKNYFLLPKVLQLNSRVIKKLWQIDPHDIAIYEGDLCEIFII